MNKKYLVLTILIFILMPIPIGYGFDNDTTHPEITEKAILSSRLQTILQEKMGFQKGIDTILYFPDGITSRFRSPAPIIAIIKDGSYAEDKPQCRASNHFYEPITNSGLSDILRDPTSYIGVGFVSYCATMDLMDGTQYLPWNSTVEWATGYTSAGSPAKISTTKKTTVNEWDWDHTKDYYYLALTSADNTVRNENFAKTFKGIGYIVHLLQDMAVPAHVRNDFRGHLEFPIWNSGDTILN